ncbi:MAG: hypothetical protein AAF598_18905, partial [Bacteroidota bacterium]
KGLPRALHEWTPAERIAFEQFATPNALAEALRDPDQKAAAEQAMRSIGHVRSSYWDWFISPDYLSKHSGFILWIGDQFLLDDDFPELLSKLGLPDSIELPRDPVKAHKNPDDLDRQLSDQAIQNLKTWYAEDFKAYSQLWAKRGTLR